MASCENNSDCTGFLENCQGFKKDPQGKPIKGKCEKDRSTSLLLILFVFFIILIIAAAFAARSMNRPKNISEMNKLY